MRLIRLSEYENLLDLIPMSSDDIKGIIKGQRLQFINIKNDFVEWKLNLPIFAESFYSFVTNNRTIPTQEEFFNYYVDKNFDYFEVHSFDNEIMAGIKARALRAMPSLVRDLYFNKYVSENLSDCSVIYNLKLDIIEGIDLLIYNQYGIYGICLFTDTKRASEVRKLKSNRHKEFDNVKYIELPISFNESKKVGDYFLYGETELKVLKNNILS